ncbi:MAG: SUMF1/EgtB/PvdO family nonheme iron enzyme [Magnetococcales bacterium]|nr:SUMF1/EgtB/PvdO family nonheme iron enzyme [Magnetococcales bacterium]
MSFDNRYENWVEIGRGAFGEVYKVFDRELGQLVAIKLLQSQHCNDPQLVETLKREVIISRKLRHDNICPIHDIYLGNRGIGTVMDFVQGKELRKWMSENKNRLLETAGDRLESFRKITAALVNAHTHIVHRDLKPANVFLKGGDPTQPMIMDFGASVVGSITKGEVFIAGTPKYMSPEQWETPGQVDQRADLFSLGIMAYELFTNKTPATSLKNIVQTKEPPKVALSDIPPPSSFCPTLPSSLDRLIVQLMAYRPDDRPSNAQEVLDALNQVQLKPLDLAGKGAPHADTLKNSTVLVPQGSFYLGSPVSIDNPCEKPAVKVEISPFRMSIFPVTNREYQAFLQATGYTAPPHGLSRVSDLPVVDVSWFDAMTYAEWIGGSLPTEAQWEYAAKGGQIFPLYPWGNDPVTPLRANIHNVQKNPTPVGSCPTGINPWGIHDLCGNVWEWCLDHWSESYYRQVTKGTLNPVNTKGGEERVLRGGAFNAMATQGRCAFRMHATPQTKSLSIGFRVIFPA